jgi:hypothetical protein
VKEDIALLEICVSVKGKIEIDRTGKVIPVIEGEETGAMTHIYMSPEGDIVLATIAEFPLDNAKDNTEKSGYRYIGIITTGVHAIFPTTRVRNSFVRTSF